MRIKWLIMILVIVVGILAWPELPDKIPLHWDISGNIDSFGSKFWIWLLPAIMLGVLLLFKLLPKIDPKKANYRRFKAEYEWIQVAIISLFAFIFIIQIVGSLNDNISIYTPRLLVGGIGLMLVMLGTPLKSLKQNFFVGIRTPWTLSNAKSWQKTHELGGRLFSGLGIIMIFDALINLKLFWSVATIALLAIVYLVVYSYYMAKQK